MGVCASCGRVVSHGPIPCGLIGCSGRVIGSIPALCVPQAVWELSSIRLLASKWASCCDRVDLWFCPVQKVWEFFVPGLGARFSPSLAESASTLAVSALSVRN